MKIASDKYHAISGRIGDMVGLMTEGGMTLRTWVIPERRDTSPLAVTRQALIDATAAWLGTLTASARLGWETYARSLLTRSTIGTKLRQSAFAAFSSSAVARSVASLARVDVPPTAPGFARHSPITPTWNSGAGTVSLAFDNSDDWAGAVGGALIVRSAPNGCGPGVNYYRGPLRYKGKVLGAVVPPTSPLTLSITYEFDGRGAIAFRVVNADGRISRPTFATGGA